MISIHEGLALVLAAAESKGSHATVLIDGPSGAGKSTFADQLIGAWQREPAPQLVRMDDIYPGWHGLDRASATVFAELLAPRASGLPSGWRRWDWQANAPAEWHAIDPQRPLVLEGCGTLSRGAAALGGIRVWISAEDTERKRRALERDGGGFDGHWDQWDHDFTRYVRRESPELHADFALESSDGLLVPTE